MPSAIILAGVLAGEGTKAQLWEQVLGERACQLWGLPLRRVANRSYGSGHGGNSDLLPG